MGDLHEARVDMLLAMVRDTISLLGHASTHREVETAEALTPKQTRAPRLSDLADAVEHLRAENAHLREALAGRAVIEQAKGIMMARHGCDADAAFGMLAEQSRIERRKVRHVASTIVAAASKGRVLPAIVEVEA